MECPELVNNKMKFSTALLRLTLVDHNEMVRQSMGSFEYMTNALYKWINKIGPSKATVENLATILEANDFKVASDSVREVLVKSGATAGTAGSSLATNPASVPVPAVPAPAKTKVPMELFENQKKFITYKCDELVGFTRNWDKLVLQLRATGLCSEPEIQKLKGMSNDTERFYEMYNLVTKQRHFFETLKECLKKSENRDAFDILEDEFEPWLKNQ
jgi:hypothetical protein